MKLLLLTPFIAGPIAALLFNRMLLFALSDNNGISYMAVVCGISAILILQVALIVFYDRIFIKQVLGKIE